MRFVSVRDLRNTPAQVWSALESEDLVLTSNGDPVAIVVKVANGDLLGTVQALRQARAQQSVSRLREQAAALGTARLTDEDIDAEIAASRKERAEP